MLLFVVWCWLLLFPVVVCMMMLVGWRSVVLCLNVRVVVVCLFCWWWCLCRCCLMSVMLLRAGSCLLFGVAC